MPLMAFCIVGCSVILLVRFGNHWDRAIPSAPHLREWRLRGGPPWARSQLIVLLEEAEDIAAREVEEVASRRNIVPYDEVRACGELRYVWLIILILNVLQ